MTRHGLTRSIILALVEGWPVQPAPHGAPIAAQVEDLRRQLAKRDAEEKARRDAEEKAKLEREVPPHPTPTPCQLLPATPRQCGLPSLALPTLLHAGPWRGGVISLPYPRLSGSGAGRTPRAAVSSHTKYPDLGVRFCPRFEAGSPGLTRRPGNAAQNSKASGPGRTWPGSVPARGRRPLLPRSSRPRRTSAWGHWRTRAGGGWSEVGDIAASTPRLGRGPLAHESGGRVPQTRTPTPPRTNGAAMLAELSWRLRAAVAHRPRTGRRRSRSCGASWRGAAWSPGPGSLRWRRRRRRTRAWPCRGRGGTGRTS
jgi:hypothetical protein